MKWNLFIVEVIIRKEPLCSTNQAEQLNRYKNELKVTFARTLNKKWRKNKEQLKVKN